MFRYTSGEEVHVGDVVLTGNNNNTGIIEQVLEPGTDEAKAFACPCGGVLIAEDWNGQKGYLSIEIPKDSCWEDVSFVRRAPSGGG
ncbi:MAG: hypothetical protein IT449_07570 [Phycisphaerales bacterium]|nr:hypothetical protein [Phycisphaerales bacterium]